MNAHATTAIRELTAQELDQVAGGLKANDPEVGWALEGAILATLFITGVTALLNWLFG